MVGNFFSGLPLVSTGLLTSTGGGGGREGGKEGGNDGGGGGGAIGRWANCSLSSCSTVVAAAIEVEFAEQAVVLQQLCRLLLLELESDIAEESEEEAEVEEAVEFCRIECGAAPPLFWKRLFVLVDVSVLIVVVVSIIDLVKLAALKR